MDNLALLIFGLSGLKVLMGFAWVVVFVGVVTFGLTLYGLARQKSLAPSHDQSLMAKDAPLVSILIPVRNEEQRVLRESVHSILSQDYGCFEVIAVNDRSTDQSAAILAEMAEADSRLRVIEGSETPAGWLGKPLRCGKVTRRTGSRGRTIR
jgi:cellulose synthase/poly-beta-1,6-N-acetylglucosamine synthase-like glycosyltransferase